jgi:hypothetical protein
MFFDAVILTINACENIIGPYVVVKVKTCFGYIQTVLCFTSLFGTGDMLGEIYFAGLGWIVLNV